MTDEALRRGCFLRFSGGSRLFALFRPENIRALAQRRRPEPPVNPAPPPPEAQPAGERKWIIAVAAAIAVLAIAAIALYPVWRSTPGATASLVGGAFKLQGPDGRVVT